MGLRRRPGGIGSDAVQLAGYPMSMNDDGQPDVRMPLMAVYFARMAAAQNGRNEDSDVLGEVLRKSAETLGPAVLAAGTSASSSPLLPFRRAMVDVWVAAAAHAEVAAPGVCLFSDVSLVRAGYLRVSRSVVEYVENGPPSGELAEMLNPHAVRDTFGHLNGVDSAPATIAFPADDSCILKFCIPAGLLAANSNPGREGKWQVALVRPGTSRNLPAVTSNVQYHSLTQGADEKYSLKGSTELMMEIHAGGAEGQWLYIAAPDFLLLGKIPDFAGEGQITVAYCHPTALLAKAMGHASCPTVLVPQRLARRIIKQHLWCSASTISD